MLSETALYQLVDFRHLNVFFLCAQLSLDELCASAEKKNGISLTIHLIFDMHVLPASKKGVASVRVRDVAAINAGVEVRHQRCDVLREGEELVQVIRKIEEACGGETSKRHKRQLGLIVSDLRLVW